MRKAIGVALIVVCAPACHTWHAEELSPQQVLAQQDVDQIRVTRQNGTRLVLMRPSLHVDTLVGFERTDENAVGNAVQIPVAEVRATATRHFSTSKTLGLVGAVLAVPFAVLLLYVNNSPY